MALATTAGTANSPATAAPATAPAVDGPSTALPVTDLAAAARATLLELPADAPAYLRATYLSAMSAPLPVAPPATGSAATMAVKVPVPATVGPWDYRRNPEGGHLVYLRDGQVLTARNAFFRSLGSNGRSCFSCHQPASGMSLSAAALRQAFDATGGRDPVFAPVDASTCPVNVPAASTSGAPLGGATGSGTAGLRDAYSLLLDRGLFRVFLPLPKATSDLSAYGGLPAHRTEFHLSVVSDPYGCNSKPTYVRVVDPVTQEVTRMISVYRRPRMAANLPLVLQPAFSLGVDVPRDPVTGAPVVDPATGRAISGNLMTDGREPTLESQARDATLGHAQAAKAPTAAQIAQIVAFESQVFVSQIYSNRAGPLSGPTVPVYGNPDYMARQPVSFGGFALYDAWLGPADSTASAMVQAQRSIARGQALFNTKAFRIDNVAGFNNARGVSNPASNTCASCHGNLQAGNDPLAAGHHAIGIGGQQQARGGPAPSPDLPIFKLTCRAPFTTPFDGPVVLTNDPGLALITGRCADIGRKSVPQIRALAGRAPYFSDGSAATLREVVDFYEKRFKMGLTEQQKLDLTNFLAAL